MAYKISIKTKYPGVTLDYEGSRFFGSPLVPAGWEDKFSPDVMFFGQIRLSDIAALDKEQKLPHTGYLYIFLDIGVYPYVPIIEYYDGVPDTIIDGFNECFDISGVNKSYEMVFTDGKDDGCFLFGEYDGELDPRGDVLLRYDPLEIEDGLLSGIDGYLYFMFGEDSADISSAKLIIERS